jgi:hypothetical protein
MHGPRALLYFPETRAFATFNGDVLEAETWTVPGEVLALRLTAQGAEAAVRDGSTVRVVRPDHAVLHSFAADGPVEFFPGGIAITIEGRLQIRRDSGAAQAFDLDGIQSFVPPASGYLGIRSAQGTFLLDLRTEHLWQVPE